MSTAATTADVVGQQFSERLDRHRRMVFKVAYTYARDAADREDLAQEIAAQLWRAYPGYDPARPFSTWLYRIALNVAISHVRQEAPRQRRTVPFDATRHDPPAPEAASDEPARLLEQFIATLDPLNRALLLLYLDEHTAREIAEILGIGESNVTTRINRLKGRVRRFGETHGTR
jgi:RNA polymerase sigma-70 factor (ECF subfamily)